MAGLETAISLAHPAIDIEIIEQGPSERLEHVKWDKTPHSGDEKVQTWTSTNWGEGGGLSERLGGRSLCWHGVVLEIEPEALASWPSEWQEKLTGQDGLYSQTFSEISRQYPPQALGGKSPERLLEQLDMKRVPQVARYDQSTHLFTAYSPLQEARKLAQKSDGFRFVRETVRSVEPQRDGRWAVNVTRSDGSYSIRKDFDACVLAASAIGNIQIMAQALDQQVATKITDHFNVGYVGWIADNGPSTVVEHPMLYSGYRHDAATSSNLFLQQMRAPLGGYAVELCGIIEQGETRKEYSTLVATPGPNGVARAHIEAQVSQKDIDRLEVVKNQLADIVSQLTLGIPRFIEDGNIDFDTARVAVGRSGLGSFAPYTSAYGAYEHESCTHPVGGEGLLGITHELESKELSGIFLAGPGSFSRMGAANPSLTTLAMSRALGTVLQSRYV